MESEQFEKQMFSTNRKEKIFNVRKMPYKQYENQKCLKSNFSPFQKKETQREPVSTQPKKTDYLILTMTGTPHKELARKLQALKEEQGQEKQRRLEKLKQREEELGKYRSESLRLEEEKAKLIKRKEEIRGRIEELRERNEAMRQEQMQRNEEIRAMNMEYLRNMIMGMRYQNGLEIDPDTMTYQELLELEEKMGNVSKGLTQQEMTQMAPTDHVGLEEPCSICCDSVKQGEKVLKLPCKHFFHLECIRQWLLKQRKCPICKQELFNRQVAP